MNQTFNFSRWRMLVAAHWAQNRKRYLLALPAMGGILVAWYSFLLIVVRHGPLEDYLQSTTYFAGLYFIGCLFASALFTDLGHRAEAINFLCLPASHLEKLLCALLFGVILFFACYTVVYYIVDIPIVHIANRLKSEGKFLGLETPGDRRFPVVNIFSEKIGSAPGINLRYFLQGFFAIQSVFILGSIWFNRLSFIKTIVSVLLFLLLLLVFTKEVTDPMVPHGWRMYGWFAWWQGLNGEGTRFVRLPMNIQEFLFFLMKYCLPFIFWTITYFRLKEKQV
jgi:hypothetical protein